MSRGESLAKLGRLVACAAGLSALAGCGMVATPEAAIGRQFGQNEISRIYPFHAVLGRGTGRTWWTSSRI